MHSHLHYNGSIRPNLGLSISPKHGLISQAKILFWSQCSNSVCSIMEENGQLDAYFFTLNWYPRHLKILKNAIKNNNCKNNQQVIKCWCWYWWSLLAQNGNFTGHLSLKLDVLCLMQEIQFVLPCKLMAYWDCCGELHQICSVFLYMNLLVNPSTTVRVSHVASWET